MRRVLLVGIFGFGLLGNVVADIGSGLVAHYLFDGNANDSSGNGHHGTENGGVTYSTGKSGQAASFDGVNDYVQTPLAPVYEVIDSLTISVWINSRNTSDAAILGFEQTKRQELSVRLLSPNSNSVGRFYLCDDNWNASYADTAQSLNDSKWHFIAAVRDASVDKLYLYSDGVLIDTVVDATNTSINQSSPISLAIGGSNHLSRGIIGYFTGEIDELRIYNRALTGSEILELYQGEPSGSDRPQISVQKGFIKLEITDSITPLDSDCAREIHEGRMLYDSFNHRIYICSQSGWQTK